MRREARLALAENFDQVIQGHAAVDDVFDHDDVEAFNGRIQILG